MGVSVCVEGRDRGKIVSRGQWEVCRGEGEGWAAGGGRLVGSCKRLSLWL